MERWIVETICEFEDIYNSASDLECYRFKKKESYNELVKYLEKGMENDTTSLGDYYRFFLANVYLYVKELKNLALGFNLAKEVADRGNLKAQLLVGNLYEEGKGVKKNLTEAYKYYRLAAEKDDRDAVHKMKLKYLYYENDEEEKEFRYWVKKSASLGDLNDLNSIIVNYKMEENYEKVYELCIDLINKAALNKDYYNYNLGFRGTLQILAELYIKGLGIEKNIEKGLNILEMLANSNDTTAQETLGFMYLDGDGVDKDSEKGIYWLKIAAKDYGYDARARLEELGIEYECD